MSKYVIAKYIRLSLDDTVTDSLSISNQRRLLDEFIDSLDLPNAEVLEFVDNGYSGTNLERPAVRDMLNLVQQSKVDCIVTKDFSRLSRNEIDSSFFIEQVFPLYRIRFISVSDGFDSDDHKNSTGGIEVSFKLLMHEYYSIDLSRKVKSAKYVQMRNGENIVANAIYGYRKNDLGKWEPDGEAAEVVRRIFRMALDGLPTALIRDELCAAKYPTPREYIEKERHNKDIDAECVWTARMVLHILENEQYTGTYISGKQESKAVGSHSKINTDKSKWIVIPGHHTPIISKEDYAAVKELLVRLKGAITVKPVENRLQDERRSKRSRMVSGEWVAATPIYGYAKDENGRWEIDKSAAAIVREIFDLARQGRSCSEISAKLSEAGQPTPAENVRIIRGHDITPLCRWTDSSVLSILKNIQYTGAFVSGKILKDYDTGKSYHTPESDWIIIPEKNPPIVGREMFDEVQEVLAANRRKRKNMRPRNHLLRGGILKCGCCGYALSYDAIADPVYRCHHTTADPGAECHKMKANARELDEAVLAIIRAQAKVVIEYGDLSGYRKTSAAAKQSNDVETQIRQLEEQRQQCYEQFMCREIDNDTFRAVKADYAVQIDRLNNRLAVIKQTELDKDAYGKTAALAAEALSETAEPRDIINSLVNRISVFPGNHIEIQWKFANFADIERKEESKSA